MHPPCYLRFLGALAYVGVAPLGWLLPRWRRTPFLHHHGAQAAGILALLWLIGLAFVVVVAAFSILFIQYRGLYEDLDGEGWILFVFRKLVLAWCVFPVFGAGLALGGCAWELPLANYLGNRRNLRRTVFCATLCAYGAGIVTTGMATHATARAEEAGPAPVYMLYDNSVPRPRWLFALAFLPVTRAAEEIHGPGAAVVAELSADNLAEALLHARFVFLAAHGKAEGIIIDREYVAPKEAAALEKNPDLAFVYLAGCDSGAQAVRWQEALAPAEVVTYDRLTAVIEHIVWMWTRGPEVVRGIAAGNAT
ncbi:MAG: hypothetical protein ACLFTT_02655 [Candidatus Hydrogenedentota bacterium]